MGNWAAVLVAALAVGCATREDVRSMVYQAPEWELCYITVAGHENPVVVQEVSAAMNARRVDCRPHMDMVRAKIAADANQRGGAAPIYPGARTCVSVQVAPGMTQLVCQ